jgi:hypothetical protein
MAFFAHKNNFFAKVRQKKVNFSISSFFLSAQHVRAGPQHAQALTLGLNKNDQVVLKLCQKIEVLRQLLARDLATQRALHEHSLTTSQNQKFALSPLCQGLYTLHTGPVFLFQQSIQKTR